MGLSDIIVCHFSSEQQKKNSDFKINLKTERRRKGQSVFCIVTQVSGIEGNLQFLEQTRSLDILYTRYEVIPTE